MQSAFPRAFNILTGGPVTKTAICVPHPDDEVIGASSLLMSLGARAFVIYITDGAPKLERDGYNRILYAEIRRREAEQVLRFCGIPLQNAFWLNLSDQQVSFDLAKLAAEIRGAVLQIKPDVIVAPPYEGGHPDHDSTALATAFVCTRVHGCRRLELLSYHNCGGRIETDRFLVPLTQVPEQRVLLTNEESSRKAAMFALYTSQREVLRHFPIGEERFRVAPEYNFLEPPHTGTLYYELFPWGIKGSQWRKHARIFLQNSEDLFR